MANADTAGCGKRTGIGEGIRGITKCGNRELGVGLVLCAACKLAAKGPAEDPRVQRSEEHAALARNFLSSD